MTRAFDPSKDPFHSIARGDGSSLWRALRNGIPLTVTSDDLKENQPEERQEETLVHAAVRHRRVQMVRSLIRMGAPAELPDTHGVTPMMLAVSIGSDEVLRILLKENVAVDGKGRDGATPLMWTAEAWDRGVPTQPAELAQMLLAAGADIHAQDDHGRTALAWAVTRPERGAEELVDVLLDAGADPGTKDKDDFSPIEVAELYTLAADGAMARLRARYCLERILAFQRLSPT